VSQGDEVTVGLTVSPSNARNAGRVTYSVSNGGILEINETSSSNEGVVFRAAGYGTAVIIAKYENLIDYCNVVVSGYKEEIIPHITLSNNVVEIPLGEKRNVIAQLQGGGAADNGGFSWFNLNNETLRLNAAANVGVIEGIERGSGKIRITHPKAQYNVEGLFFVLGVNEVAKYITSKNNVVILNKNEEYDMEDYYGIVKRFVNRRIEGVI
jgi:hypothetical protein